MTVQQYVSQYRNINFSTKKSFGTEKLEKNWKKSVGISYDYYYVPKYMLIIVHPNKPYIFHYLTIIPRTRMGSVSIAHEVEGRMGY